MSLTYCSEHLAWQQRVGQERSRSKQFLQTHQSFFSPLKATKVPFPNVGPPEHNYKSFNFDLGYAFGGTRRIQEAARRPERRAGSASYMKSLEQKLARERLRRIRAELKLTKQSE